MKKNASKSQSTSSNKINKVLNQRYSNLSMLSPAPRIPKESYSTTSAINSKLGFSKK